MNQAPTSDSPPSCYLISLYISGRNRTIRYDPLKHHRSSIRLHAYDYAAKGSYFVTICTREHECLLGEIANGEMTLSQIGEIVQRCWLDLSNHFPDMTLDEYQSMPNHVHGIVVLWGNHGRDLIAPNRRRTGNQIPTSVLDENFVTQTDWPSMKNPNQTVGKIIRHFKAKATKNIHDAGFDNFAWHGRFHDHIIRDHDGLHRIREYIQINPANWIADEENPRSSRKEKPDIK